MHVYETDSCIIVSTHTTESEEQLTALSEVDECLQRSLHEDAVTSVSLHGPQHSLVQAVLHHRLLKVLWGGEGLNS